MQNFIKTIWKDPVWSKVISAGIIALLTLLYYSFLRGTEFEQALVKILNGDIKIWHIIIAVILISIFIYVFFRYLKDMLFYNDEHKKLDRDFFLKIKNELLPVNGPIDFIRTNNFAGYGFRNEYVEPIYRIAYYFDDPEFEFIDSKLNKLFTKLKVAINKFNGLISLNTWHIDNPNLDANWVPPEWEEEQPERFRRVVSDIHNVTKEICILYDELIKMGRRKYGV